VTVDLPGIAIENKADLNIEIFVIDPDDGLTGWHICQAHVVDKGDGIEAIQENAVYEDHLKTGHPTIVRGLPDVIALSKRFSRLQIEKTSILLEQVHTNGAEAPDTTNNQLIFQFQAVMVATSDLVSNKRYYITAGVEYGDEEYVWIGQAEVISVLINRVSSIDCKFTTFAMAEPDLGRAAPQSLRKGARRFARRWKRKFSAFDDDAFIPLFPFPT